MSFVESTVISAGFQLSGYIYIHTGAGTLHVGWLLYSGVLNTRACSQQRFFDDFLGLAIFTA